MACKETYVVYRGSMLRKLDDLDSDIVPNAERDIRYEWHLWKAETPIVLHVCRSAYGEGWDNVVGHIGRC